MVVAAVAESVPAAGTLVWVVGNAVVGDAIAAGPDVVDGADGTMIDGMLDTV